MVIIVVLFLSSLWQIILLFIHANIKVKINTTALINTPESEYCMMASDSSAGPVPSLGDAEFFQDCPVL